MLVFRTNSTATAARKNKGSKSFASIATAIKKREQEQEQARAAARAKAEAEAEAKIREGQQKKRGRPSKAAQAALEAEIAQARSSARSSIAEPTAFIKPSTPRSEKTGSVAAQDKREKRAKLRAQLVKGYKAEKIDALKKRAKAAGLEGFSQMTKAELIRALVQAEVNAAYPKMVKAPKARTSRKGIVPSAATRQKISAKHKAKQGRRAGVGIYRVAVLVNGDFDKDRGADLGPYATARAAAIDAKTLLRTAARVEDHRISQKTALDMIDAGDESLEQFKTVGLGEVVDGFIVDGAVNGRNWEAWVYRVSSREPATSRALLDNVLPAGKKVQSMALRANSRRNGTVSFRTRDGRKISFRARK